MGQSPSARGARSRDGDRGRIGRGDKKETGKGGHKRGSSGEGGSGVKGKGKGKGKGAHGVAARRIETLARGCERVAMPSEPIGPRRRRLRRGGGHRGSPAAASRAAQGPGKRHRKLRAGRRGLL